MHFFTTAAMKCFTLLKIWGFFHHKQVIQAIIFIDKMHFCPAELKKILRHLNNGVSREKKILNVFCIAFHIQFIDVCLYVVEKVL